MENEEKFVRCRQDWSEWFQTASSSFGLVRFVFLFRRFVNKTEEERCKVDASEEEEISCQGSILVDKAHNRRPEKLAKPSPWGCETHGEAKFAVKIELDDGDGGKVHHSKAEAGEENGEVEDQNVGLSMLLRELNVEAGREKAGCRQEGPGDDRCPVARVVQCCWHQLSYAILTQFKAPTSTNRGSAKAPSFWWLELCLYGRATCEWTTIPVSQPRGEPGRDGTGSQGEEGQERVGQGGLGVVHPEGLLDAVDDEAEVPSEAGP